MELVSQIIDYIKKNKIEIIIVFAVLIFFFIMYKFRNVIEKLQNKNTIEIVVSRYNEELKWLNEDPFSRYPVICYNKGVNENYKIKNMKKSVKLANVGRESHTYLYHIINNYDNLADITIFLPGSADSKEYNKQIRSILLAKECENANTSVIIGVKHNSVKKELYNFAMNNYKSTTPENRKINSETILDLCKIRPYGKWFDNKFPDVDIEYIPYSGIIAISKEHILQHPRSYYERLMDELSYSSNPEVGHYFERSWVAVFHPLTNARFIDASSLF
jgi:hypothetical protein